MIVKAKYYEDTEEIIPLDPQPLRSVDGKWNYERSGSDEKGKFVVIDFISEEPVYFGYDAEGIQEKAELTIITEDEWNKTLTHDIESMDLTIQRPVEYVDALTSPKPITTNTKTSQATFSTVIERLMLTIGRLFSNVLDAIGLTSHN